MRYPSLSRKSKRRVIIPQLSGGINSVEAPSYVADNQLTDCNNVYFDKGRLRTRPPFIQESEVSFVADEYCKSGGTAWMLSNEFIYNGNFAYPNLLAINEENSTVNLQESFESTASRENRYLTIPFNNNDEDGILRLQGEPAREGINVECIKMVRGDEVKIEYDQEIYIPTVLINGKGSDTPVSCEVTGTLYEGYNMLTDSYKMLVTADGIESMVWKLPRQTKGGEIIKVELTDPVKGQITHVINLDNNLDRSENFAFTRYVSQPVVATYIPEERGESVEYLQKVAYDAYTNTIVFVAKLQDEEIFGMHIRPVSVGAYGNSSSNVRITVFSQNGNDKADTILGMTNSCWFGGSRGGIGGGTRLFVSGNPDCPGAVYWSDLNRPTYFPENNYAYVGDSSTVTALAQQSDLLVIFQKNAITVSQYVQGETVTSTDLTSGAVVDITTMAASFPMTPVHSSIGCDCPDSVQLCSNRLVWLGSEGKVYTLVSYGQYNERNVREVSYLIEPLLKRHSVQSLKNAKSVDVNGKYCLFVDDKVYLLDYESAAFKGYTSYSADKNAQRNMAWYVWTLPDFMSSVSQVFGMKEKAVVISNNKICSFSFSYEGGEDFDGENMYKVPCHFKTKQFVFGAPDYMKNIESVVMTVGSSQSEI